MPFKINFYQIESSGLNKREMGQKLMALVFLTSRPYVLQVILDLKIYEITYGPGAGLNKRGCCCFLPSPLSKKVVTAARILLEISQYG